MDDKIMMSTVLGNDKGMCDLMMHGTIESATPDVHQAFNSALSDSLCMQDQVYQTMSSKGWYQTQSAQQQQLDAVKQKFAQR